MTGLFICGSALLLRLSTVFVCYLKNHTHNTKSNFNSVLCMEMQRLLIFQVYDNLFVFFKHIEYSED